MTNPVTVDREHLRKLAEAASRGPWTASGGYVSADSGRDGISGYSTRADAEFIAAARSALPALLDALDQAEARIKAVRDVLDREERANAALDIGSCGVGVGWSATASVADIRRALDGSPDGDPARACGRGPCCLGDRHDGNCRL